MFKGQPKGLFALALANTGERFGYYTMLAIFLLFIQAKFGFSAAAATQIYSIFLAGVYFMPLFGGILADKIGFGRCVTIGFAVMFLGYLCLSIPTGPDLIGKVLMFGALALIAIGTGLFKGNLQVMVGNLYDDPRYASKRDSAFSLFYMAINIGAMFAPSAAKAVTNYFLGKSGLSYDANIPALAHQFLDGTITPENVDKIKGIQLTMTGASGMDLSTFCSTYIEKLSTAYNYGFAVACISLIISVLIYFSFKSWFRHADVNAKQAKETQTNEPALSPEQTRNRITALMLVFAVVIFFWMAFHQNGGTMTIFARDYTQGTVDGILRLGFNIVSLGDIGLHPLRGSTVEKRERPAHIRTCDVRPVGSGLPVLQPDGPVGKDTAVRLPAVQPVLRCGSHPCISRHIRSTCKERQGTVSTEENRHRNDCGRSRIPHPDHRLAGTDVS